MATYEWLGGKACFDVEPRTVGRCLEEVRAKNGGALEPQAVVEAARPRASPLHGCFEWDDGIAAEKYRLSQASFLIRHLVVRYRGPKGSGGTVRAFVRVSRDDKVGFHPIAEVMGDKAMRADLLARGLAELEIWRHRYEHLQEFARVVSEIRSVSARRRGKRGRAA